MSTTAKPRLMRMNQKAVLVPVAQFARWYTIASATAGLSELDRAMLDVIAGYYRELGERGVASFPSIKAMARIHVPREFCIVLFSRSLSIFASYPLRPGDLPLDRVPADLHRRAQAQLEARPSSKPTDRL